MRRLRGPAVMIGALVLLMGCAPAPTATPTEEVPPMPEMVLVEAGTFEMGSSTWNWDVMPVHAVTISRDFYMGKYPVTHESWAKYRESAVGVRRSVPDEGEPWDSPVGGLTWNDAVAYCNWLSEKHGFTPCYTGKGNATGCDFAANGYRLPTEAEWEFAARGGNESRGYLYSGSDDPGEVAWYVANSGGRYHSVGQKKPNELGIHDMSGQLWEWCWDWYGEDYYQSSPEVDPVGPSSGRSIHVSDADRVKRGGNVVEEAETLRVTRRGADGSKYPGGGVRLVRTR